MNEEEYLKKRLDSQIEWCGTKAYGKDWGQNLILLT